MISPKVVTASGLTFDLVGALLLWKYGLPEAVSRDGSIRLVCQQRDDAEVAKARRYDRFATVGLALISTGFFLQLLATFL
ncbi:MAG: hypothetical protein VKK97_10110 [Synechococcaceae cyanobacterium]|nr:hypothetical protein [Synechococcaceae cyanobacterium]